MVLSVDVVDPTAVTLTEAVATPPTGGSISGSVAAGIASDLEKSISEASDRIDDGDVGPASKSHKYSLCLGV